MHYYNPKGWCQSNCLFKPSLFQHLRFINGIKTILLTLNRFQCAFPATSHWRWLCSTARYRAIVSSTSSSQFTGPRLPVVSLSKSFVLPLPMAFSTISWAVPLFCAKLKKDSTPDLPSFSSIISFAVSYFILSSSKPTCLSQWKKTGCDQPPPSIPCY